MIEWHPALEDPADSRGTPVDPGLYFDLVAIVVERTVPYHSYL